MIIKELFEENVKANDESKNIKVIKNTVKDKNDNKTVEVIAYNWFISEWAVPTVHSK